MQAESYSWTSGAADVSSASPQATWPEWHGDWSMGLAGMLVIVCAIGVLFFFFRGLYRRKDIWEPLWMGSLALVLGLAGTVADVITVMSRMASLGDVVNQADFSYGMAHALTCSFMGLTVLAVSIFCSLLLWRRRPGMGRHEGREPAEE